MGLVLSILTTAAVAQPEAATAATGGMSLGEIMKAGGLLMWVLAALSVATLAFIIYLFSSLTSAHIAPDDLQRELLDALRTGALERARRLCEERPCPLASVARTAIEHSQSAPEILKDVIEGEGSRQAEDLQGMTQYLLDIAVIAPMVGLLGTVFGMLHAFSGVAHDIASAKPVVLAEGVAMALLTTAFGLIIGIPAMAFYAYFRRRALKQVLLLETSAAEILSTLLNRNGVCGGRIAEIKDQLRKA